MVPMKNGKKLDINAKLKTFIERIITASIDTSFILPQKGEKKDIDQNFKL